MELDMYLSKEELVNGGTYLVSREELEKLRNTCE